MAAELSQVSGTNGPPLLDETIGEALAKAARRWPEAEALVSCAEGLRFTFAELDHEVTRLAAGFLTLGLRPGDRIGIWSPNCAAWTLTQFGAARAGLILVTINPAYRTTELEHALGSLGVRAIVCAESFKASDYCQMLEMVAGLGEARSRTPSLPRLPNLRYAIHLGPGVRPGWIRFSDIAGLGANGPPPVLCPAIGPDDPINVQFTSGTTGLPKGATLTHRNILNNGFFVGRAAGLGLGDRLCIPVPLYHCFGMVLGNLACVAHGASMVYPGPGFDPAETLAALSAERCTHLYGVPTMFIAILRELKAADVTAPALHGGIMAGAPCPVEVMRAVIDVLGMRDVTIAYGMTETSPVSFQTAPSDPFDKRIETVGRVQPHLQCKLVDEFGEVVARGMPGELCTKGYSVMLGYWGDPERTAEAIDADGWMHSGDIATIDEQGYCRIVGRSKDMVIRGGENIYPREIEEFFHTHPEVVDVAVVGVPDDIFGEELCAWVQVSADSQLNQNDLIAYARGRIAHYKIPKYIRIVDSFPMTVTGKIQKYLMREQMAPAQPGPASGKSTR